MLNIIFIVTCYPILFLMYFLLKNAGDRNNWCFGVTLTKEQKKYPAIVEIDADYKKKMKSGMIVMAIVPVITFFIPYMSIGYTIWMVWMILVCFYPMVWYAKANMKVQDVKKRYQMPNVDDDKYWKYGLFYCNKTDKHLMVENRMGTGTALNMATGVAKGSYIFAIICLLIVPVSVIWMIMLDFTPIQTRVENNTIVCQHLSVEYEIPLENIIEYEVLNELPEMTKMSGNGMDNVCSGTYEIYREGKVKVFFKPHNDLYIKLVTEEETYYISGVNDDETQKLIDIIETQE